MPTLTPPFLLNFYLLISLIDTLLWSPFLQPTSLYLLMLVCLCLATVLSSAFWDFFILCHITRGYSSESSWTPKTQPNDSKAAIWLSFWCSTRPSADTGTDYYYQWLNDNPAGCWIIGDAISTKSMYVSVEGRVDHQKLNQMAALLSFVWVFGFQLDIPEKNLITLPELTFTVIFNRNSPPRNSFP